MAVFEKLFDAFGLLWNLITNTISGIVTFFNVVLNSITVPTQLVSVLPSFLSASVLAVFSIAIVKLIIGWGNS